MEPAGIEPAKRSAEIEAIPTCYCECGRALSVPGPEPDGSSQKKLEAECQLVRRTAFAAMAALEGGDPNTAHRLLRALVG